MSPSTLVLVIHLRNFWRAERTLGPIHTLNYLNNNELSACENLYIEANIIVTNLLTKHSLSLKNIYVRLHYPLPKVKVAFSRRCFVNNFDCICTKERIMRTNMKIETVNHERDGAVTLFHSINWWWFRLFNVVVHLFSWFSFVKMRENMMLEDCHFSGFMFQNY